MKKADKIKEIKAKMLDLVVNTGGQELDHMEADNLLCELLELLGHHDIVFNFKQLDKWYA
jgi:hypothetical protein